MVKYKYIDHTADIGFVAYGKSIEELFNNSFEAFVDLMIDRHSVTPQKQVEFSVSESDYPSLLKAFLHQFLLLFEVDSFIPFAIEHIAISKMSVKVIASGEYYEPVRHQLKAQIKAVTYHGLKVCRQDRSWTATVILDL